MEKFSDKNFKKRSLCCNPDFHCSTLSNLCHGHSRFSSIEDRNCTCFVLRRNFCTITLLHFSITLYLIIIISIEKLSDLFFLHSHMLAQSHLQQHFVSPPCTPGRSQTGLQLKTKIFLIY